MQSKSSGPRPMLERLGAAASRALGVIAATTLFAMMALTFVDVIGRYGFHHSIFGAAEIIEYLMMAAVFAGLAMVTAKGEHISVTLMEPMVTRLMARPQRWMSVAMSVGCTLLISWQLFEHALDLFRSGKRTAVLELPQWVLPMLGAALSLAGLLLLLLALGRSRGRP